MPSADPTRHANNFDFLRLVAALTVIFSHSFLISAGTQANEPLVWLSHNQCPLGLVGVFVFFVISGYLVTESFCRAPKAGGFILRRTMRIYPALVLNGLVCAFVLGPIVTSLPLSTYFADHGLRDFLVEYATLWPGPLALPGVLFANTTVGLLVNGSFWTLRFEVYMYLTVLVLGLARGLRLSTSVMLLVVGISAIYWDQIHSLSWLGDVRGWLWMLSHFAAGMVMYFLRGRIVFRWYYAVLAVAGLVLISQVGHQFITFFALPGGYLTIYAGSRYWPKVDYARYVGDLSYGIYIYGWPCEEFVKWLSNGQAVWWQVFLGALALALPLSWLSWHGVEKWALRWVRGRRRTAIVTPALPQSIPGGF
jgi:peptidoglycan/LPS O-acetylase OafA/YrhL